MSKGIRSRAGLHSVERSRPTRIGVRVTETHQVHAAIASVISEMPAIGKESEIKEGPQKYKYRGIEQIKAELKLVMAKHGVHYAPHRIRDAQDSAYETRSGATWQRVRLTVTYRIYGPDGSYIEAEGRGEGADSSDKAQNKAMTGAEKQVLLQVFAIADSEDPDQLRPPEQVPLVMIDRAQANRRVLHELKENGWARDPAIAKAAALMSAVVGDGPFPEVAWVDVFARAASEMPVGAEAVS